MSKIAFATTIVEMDLGVTASSVTDDCFKYGITFGCDVDCPVLISGNCKLKDDENKDLHKEAMENES